MMLSHSSVEIRQDSFKANCNSVRGSLSVYLPATAEVAVLVDEANYTYLSSGGRKNVQIELRSALPAIHAPLTQVQAILCGLAPSHLWKAIGALCVNRPIHADLLKPAMSCSRLCATSPSSR